MHKKKEIEREEELGKLKKLLGGEEEKVVVGGKRLKEKEVSFSFFFSFLSSPFCSFLSSILTFLFVSKG